MLKMRKVGFLWLLCLMALACLIPPVNAASGKAIRLAIWSGYPEMAPFYQKVIEDYKKENPEVEVTFLTNPLREHEQKISAAIPANTAADIIETSTYVMQKFIDAGLIDPNPPKVDKFLKSGVYDPFYVTLNTSEGKTYGVPFFQGRQVMFWNTQMFKEAGLSHAPTTWEEVIDFSRKLAKYDAQGNLSRAGISLRKSGGGSGVTEKWWFWVYPAGGSIVEQVSKDKWRNGYDNDAGRSALKLYIDLIHKYKVDSHKIKADAEGFALQTHAMFTRESWVVGYMKQNAPSVQFDTAPLPKNKRAGTICTLMNFYVTKSSKNPEAAWDFVLFMMRPEYQKYLLSKVGWFPCRTDVDYEEIYKQVPQYRAFMALPAGYQLYAYPSLACYDEIQTKLSERLIQAFLDASLVDNPGKIARVISDAARETDDILRANGVYAGK
ncbi:MAG TPA: extracellular solute-binding protein [Firmicutes bacterium]|nr:extracellular solute-binding protein [Bacillota bacterium]